MIVVPVAVVLLSGILSTSESGQSRQHEELKWQNLIHDDQQLFSIAGNCSVSNPCPSNSDCVPVNATAVNCNCKDNCSVLMPATPQQPSPFCEDMCYNSCLNGGTCVHAANCSEAIGTYCVCPPTHTGLECEEEIEFGSCENHTCPDDSTCVPIVSNHTCNCTKPCHLFHTDIHECRDVCNGACGGFGDCVFDPNTCLNDNATNWGCQCRNGYSGFFCEVPPAVRCGNPTINATDTTQNFTFPSSPQFNCIWTLQAAMENVIDINITSIDISPTARLTVVSNNVTMFDYSTSTNTLATNQTTNRFATINVSTNGNGTIGFFMSFRSTPFDACTPNPCLHNGACVTQLMQPNCRCPSCWTGPRCETPQNNPCDFYDVAFCAPFGQQCLYNITACCCPYCAPP